MATAEEADVLHRHLEPREVGQRSRNSAARGKEGLEQGSRVLGEEAGGHLDLVIEFGIGEHLEARTESAAFGIVGGVDETGNPRLDDGAGTHGTGLESDVEGGVGKAIVAEKRELSRMTTISAWAVGSLSRMVRLPERARTASFMDEDCTDGDLSGFGRGAGFSQSEMHAIAGRQA